MFNRRQKRRIREDIAEAKEALKGVTDFEQRKWIETQIMDREKLLADLNKQDLVLIGTLGSAALAASGYIVPKAMQIANYNTQFNRLEELNEAQIKASRGQFAPGNYR